MTVEDPDAVMASVLRKALEVRMPVTPAMPAAYRRLTADVSVTAPTARGMLMPPLALTTASNVPPAAVILPGSVMLPEASTCGMASRACWASVAELAALVAEVAALVAAVLMRPSA